MLWTKFSSIHGPLLLLFLISIAGGGMADTGNRHPLAKKQAFANRLYKAVAEEHRKNGQDVNLIFSPLSLEMVLSAAGMGARGTTQEEMSSAIGIPFELEPMKGRYSPILVDLKNDSCILRVATHMFVQEDYSLRQNFINGSRDVFECGAAEVNFVTQPQAALDRINGWVEEKTERLIKNLLSIDAITPDTRLVLANAVYFKGKWAFPFDKESTRKDKFHVAGGEKVDVDMMFIEKRFRHGYVDDLKAQVLELPYEGGKLSMVILLPYKDSSIQELEGKVSSPDFDLAEVMANHTHSQEVMVYLPKFKLELTTNLENVLMKLGMTTMFSDNADFSGITASPEGLKVSKVVQKAFIEVSEEGTEAAAATGMVMVTRYSIITIRRQIFKADRPFIFYLKEKLHGNVLFAGSCHKFNP